MNAETSPIEAIESLMSDIVLSQNPDVVLYNQLRNEYRRIIRMQTTEMRINEMVEAHAASMVHARETIRLQSEEISRLQRNEHML